MFPLVTNDLKLSALEVLYAYKGQPQIERRFKQLKTDFLSASVFLEDIGRIEAFLCVYFFALLVESLLERGVRMTIKVSKESNPCPSTRKAATPNGRRRGVCWISSRRSNVTSSSNAARSPKVAI